MDRLLPTSVFQASRAQILKKAAEYISAMRRKSSIQSNDIEDLKRQNSNIENQSRCYLGGLGIAISISRPNHFRTAWFNLGLCSPAVRQLERARDSYNGNDGDAANGGGAAGGNAHDGEEDSSEEPNTNGGGGGAYGRRTKKIKTSNGGY